MARKADIKPFDNSLGYTQCSWESGGIRCLYPGSISHNISGAGPWFCRWHFDCTDPIYGMQVIDQSKSYRHVSEREKLRDRQSQALANLDKCGLARLADESTQEWTERMRQFVRERAKTIGRLKEAA